MAFPKEIEQSIISILSKDMKCYINQKIPDDYKVDICTDAAYRGHLEVLKWARDQGSPWD
jgi:hypothetical protein